MLRCRGEGGEEEGLKCHTFTVADFWVQTVERFTDIDMVTDVFVAISRVHRFPVAVLLGQRREVVLIPGRIGDETVHGIGETRQGSIEVEVALVAAVTAHRFRHFGRRGDVAVTRKRDGGFVQAPSRA